MASTYSTNLALELIGTGDQAGTWGNTTNTNLGTLIEQAISGYVTQAVATGTDTTITIPNGATGVARNMYIELTGTGGTNTNLIVPSNKKLYFIFNNSTGAVTVKVSGQTGVSVPQGKKVVLTSNGTDVVNGLNYIADFGSNSATITQLSATSATITNLTLTSLVISNLSIASANITTLTSSSATISTTLALSGGTANCVLYLNGSKVASSNANLVYDGTNLTATRKLIAASSGVAVSSFVDGLSVGGYDSIGFAASPATALAIGGYRTSQWSGLEFYTSGTLKAVLDTSGNLGIGTTSPATNLSVVGTGITDASSNGAYQVTVDNNAAYNLTPQGGIIHRFKWSSAGTLTTGAGIRFYKPNTNDSDASSQIGFLVRSGIAAQSQAMTLDASGNLTVANGDITIATNGKKLYTNYIANNSGTNLNFDAANFLFNTGNVSLTSNATSFQWTNSGNNVALNGDSGILRFYTGTSAYNERARITAGGNLLVGTTTDVSGRSGVISDISGNVRAIPRTGSAKTSVYTLTVSDVGQFVELGTGGGIDVPNGVFSTGDVVSVFNNTTGNRTISLTITTAYIGGTDSDKASVTLATRGVATVLFISNSVCVVNGNVS